MVRLTPLLAVVLAAGAFALPEPTKTVKKRSLTGNQAPPLGSPRPGDPIITLTGPLAPTVSPWYVAPSTPKYDYAEGVHKALLFYEIQRSGPIPTQRLAWRSDSCKVCKGAYGEDLSGAWYEAANTMKWGLPLAWTITQLGYNVYQFGEALASVNELNQALQTVKWGTDYLINAHYNDTTFVGQLGISGIGNNDDIDFAYYLAPETYELRMPQQYWHPVLYITPQVPAGDIVAESAAALAVASLIFRPYNSTYADLCLSHAESLYKFSQAYPASYTNAQNKANQNSSWYPATGWYPSSGTEGHQAIAAAFLYIATNQSSYLNQSITYYNSPIGQNAWSEQSWDSQGGHLHVLLYQLTKDPTYLTNFKAFTNQYLPGPTQTFKQTPRGLSFPAYWGTIALVMNACMDMVTMSRIIGYSDPYSVSMINFCTQQANYVLGEGGYSFMVGYGNGPYPLRLNHISSYNPYDDSPLYNESLADIQNDFLQNLTNNRRIAYGAIVSGPDNLDRYQDDHVLYQYSESTQDSSAGIIGLLAGLMEWYGFDKFKAFSDCTLDLGFTQPNASTPPQWPNTDCYHTCNTGSQCSSDITVFSQQQPATGGRANFGNSTNSTSSGAPSPTGSNHSAAALASPSSLWFAAVVGAVAAVACALL